MSRIARLSLAVALGAGALSGTAFAQQGTRYALIVQGTSGDPSFAKLHRGWLDRLAATLRTRARIDGDRLIVLAEQPGDGEQRASADNVKASLTKLAAVIKPDDLLFVMLIGHGGGQGADAKFNLVGPDLAIADWSSLLTPISGRVAVVDATSSSFPYLAGLAAPGRVVITATNSYAQKYHTIFADAFIEALGAAEADADKNGRISLLEAFNHASRLQAQHYEQDKRLATEKALLDDTGDGIGRDASASGPDGAVAGVTYLDVVEIPKVADPALQVLLVKRQELADQVDDLRRRQPEMAPADFDREFEALIVELSLVSREIRRKGATRPASSTDRGATPWSAGGPRRPAR
jgi:hypothetical protein